MHLVFFLVLVAWICDNCVWMIMMTVDLGVLMEKGISKEGVVFEERGGEEIVLQLLEEVVVAYFLEFSYALLGWVVLEIFLFPVSGHGSEVLSFRESSS